MVRQGGGNRRPVGLDLVRRPAQDILAICQRPVVAFQSRVESRRAGQSVCSAKAWYRVAWSRNCAKFSSDSFRAYGLSSIAGLPPQGLLEHRDTCRVPLRGWSSHRPRDGSVV